MAKVSAYLDDGDHDRLRRIAQVDGVSVSEAVQAAIRGHIDQRRNDPAFRERVARFLAEDKDVLEALAKGDN